MYVGSDHNNVQIFTFPEAELDSILTRFTAPVTTIAVSKDGGYVAAGSWYVLIIYKYKYHMNRYSSQCFSDMEIHLIETSTSKITFFQGHKAPILHVAIDPKIEYLV